MNTVIRERFGPLEPGRERTRVTAPACNSYTFSLTFFEYYRQRSTGSIFFAIDLRVI